MIVIEEGKQIPRRTYAGRPSLYRFGDMKVGDSFAVEIAKAPRVRAAATWWAKHHPGFTYTTRKEGENLRLWCTGVPA